MSAAILTGQQATTVAPEATAAEVARVLVASKCKAAGVTDSDGKLVGLVSVRDIIKRVVYPGKSVNDVTCRQFMTPNPAAVTEVEAANMERVLTTMAQRGFRHMPVVNTRENMKFVRMLDVLAVTQRVLSPKPGSSQVCNGRYRRTLLAHTCRASSRRAFLVL
jgi:CBS domain-containing protein